MATIEKLKPSDKQPDITRTGNTLTASVNWILKLSERVTPVTADIMLYSLGLNNIYGFPAFNTTPHPDNRTLKSLGFKTKRMDSGGERAGQVFTITVSYSNNSAAAAQSQDPIDANPIYRSENVFKEEEISVDPIKKRLIGSSNGHPAIPKLMKNRILKRHIIVRNERNYDDQRSQNTVDKLNSDVLNINGRQKVVRSILLESWDGDPQFDTFGNEYFVVTYKLLEDVKLHQTGNLDLSNELDLAGNPPPTAQPGKTTTPLAKLDGNGLYFSLEDQKDPEKFVIRQNWTNEETPLSFLGFRSVPNASINLGTISAHLGGNLGNVLQ